MTEPSTCYRVGDEHPATVKQSPPTESRHIPIVWLVTHDLERRAAEGRVKYGTLLRGFNGHDALTDAYQEALDLVMYLRPVSYTHLDVYKRQIQPTPSMGQEAAA